MQPTIDQTIERVEQLYATLTGKRPAHLNGNGAPIPPESDPLVHVHEQLDRMVALAAELLPTPRPAWVPLANVWRDEDGVSVALDIPGVTREQLQIRVEHATLTVTGHRGSPGARVVRGIDDSDAPMGSFARAFVMRAPIVVDHVTARLADGVLTIRIDNSTRGQPSQIPIRF